MATGDADWTPRIITSASNDDQVKIIVTDADSSSSFSQEVKSMVIHNDGPYPVHYNRNAASSTSKFKIPANSWFMIDVPLTTPHFICASGENATVYCYGVY